MIKSMKATNLWTMAMAALLTAGCSQNEITDISPDASPAVGFSVYATAQSRGTITDNSTSGTGIKNTTGFGALAYYTEQSNWSNTGSFSPNFMYNQQVKWATNVWTYTPVKYWPNTEGDKISFFAYAPYESSPSSGTSKGVVLSSYTATGAPTLRFTLQPTPAALIDLVATDATSTSGANQTINITKRTTAVAFKFNHLLTRVNFKAKLDAAPVASETFIFVTGMRLVGSTNHSASTFYSAATYKFADGTWDYTTATPAKQSADYAINTVMPLASQTAAINAKYTTQGIRITSTTTGDALLKSGEYLFLIPPVDNTGVDTDKMKVEIDYDIVTLDSKLSLGYSVTSTQATVSLNKGTLARSKAYDFLFTIGLEKVTVSAEVTDWSTPTDAAAPAVDATSGSAAAIGTAITTLNTTKAGNPNCNYFMVNIPFAATTSSLSLSATNGNFKTGDKIELNFTVASTVSSVTLSGWTRSGTLSGAVGSIILTKN